MGKQTETLCEHRWEQLCIRQSWDDMSQAVLMMQFIKLAGLMEQFYAFAMEEAAHENEVIRKPDRKVS